MACPASDRRRWFLRQALLAATPSVFALAGCAALQPPPPEAVLQDALFNHPPRPPGADTAMALDDAMRTFLQQSLASGLLRSGRARSLTEALYSPHGLRLRYDASSTRSAAEAFAARAGNCLSLALMTAAFAEALGLEVRFQSAVMDEVFSRNAGLTLRSGHVNLVLAPRQGVMPWQSWLLDADPNPLLVDFLPADELRSLRSVVIDRSTVLAMFMNNRAAEALARQQPALAYAWVREAMRQDASFWPAYNTLGVVYQRAGHLDAAARAYEQLLARDARQVAAMWNLAQVLQALGREAEARRWTERRLALEPVPPFHHQRLGEAALARGDAAEALAQLDREQRANGDSAELQWLRARALWLQGDAQAAQRALQQAAVSSTTPAEQQRYLGKLAWLRSQGRLAEAAGG